MTLAYADRVQEQTTTTGTGTLTLAGAVAGFQSFTTAFGADKTVTYCITSGSSNWEVGLGTFTNSGTTLSRDTVISGSSGAGTHITLSGTSNVFLVRPAESVGGTYIGTTLLTSASGTFTTGAYTTKIKIRGVAGGGGGGDANTSGATPWVGGSGGSGSYAEKTFAVSPSTAYAYTCGAAGVGGSGAGTTGGNSTFVVGATTVTCHGGVGGLTGGVGPRAGSAGGAVSTNGDVNTAGEAGSFSPSGFISSGHAGSSLLGAGATGAFCGAGVFAVAGTSAPSGYGGGGSGATNDGYQGSGFNGGAGTAGCWIVDEYA